MLGAFKSDRLLVATTAGGQAGAADLAAAQLSAQSELAINYFSLRQTDTQIGLLERTIAGYRRALEINRNRFEAGLAARADLLQAEITLDNAQIDALTLARQRAQLEHAIALLLGRTPADFTLAAAPGPAAAVPAIPTGLPSTLLQRRPDIAAAERRAPPPTPRSASPAAPISPA